MAANMKQLLEAGVHFGHQTRRWNPKMREYIFAERNGIHIIDLAQTVSRLDAALEFIRETTRRSESILFVGTKKQAQEAVREEATRAGQHYVDTRWLGGLLTNFMTIKRRIQRLEALEARREAGEFERLTKKEAGKLTEEIEKLNAAMGGIRRMRRLPGAVFVVDPHREAIAVSEARRLEIPVIAITDTNCDPDLIDWVIPANDDAIRSVRLLCAQVADAAWKARPSARRASTRRWRRSRPCRRSTRRPSAPMPTTAQSLRRARRSCSSRSRRRTRRPSDANVPAARPASSSTRTPMPSSTAKRRWPRPP